MNEIQRKTIVEFALGRLSNDELTRCLGFNIQANPDRVLVLLEEATLSESANDLECALILAFRAKIKKGLAPLLIKLLPLPWHRSHEDIVRRLQELRDPAAVNALYEAVYASHNYMAYDRGHALARKCTWALADIGTPEALAKLKLLAAHQDPVVADYALRRIDRWDEERRRKLPQE